MKLQNRRMTSLSLIMIAITAALMLPRTASLSAASFSPFSTPQNLGVGVNAANISNELSLISPSGLSLYFTSGRPGGVGGTDVYVSQRPTLSSAWGAAQNVGALNTTSNDNPGSISPDGREMFSNSNRAGGLGGADIYISTRTDPNDDLGWTTPVNLGPVINTTFGEQTPFYFVDPATGAGTLFFSSDRASGTTNIKDIYKSTRNPDGTFNPPTAVVELNSADDDNRPAISRDGLEVFFGSRRTGERRIYLSTRASTSAPWNQPVAVASLDQGGVAAQPSVSEDGTTLYFTSNRPGGIGTSDIYSVSRVSVNRGPSADFDGDGRTDLSIFRPSEGAWWVMGSSDGSVAVRQFGSSGDRIVPGDYDGDGRIDLAVFRPSDRNWYIHRSSDGVVSVTNWGLGTDKPVPGDYDGDGRTDIAVYRDGTWYIAQSSNGSFRIEQFGVSSDVPVSGAGAGAQ